MIRPPRRRRASSADRLLPYRAATRNLFLIGSHDRNVTILSQQVRALNLAWALQAEGVLIKRERPRVAVVGGGFAGVTFVAGLVQTGTNADITLFERRDTLLPLQHGSDSRWVHPHIYDWPAPGSESTNAALPIMNWSAGRASDVVVSVLNEWKSLIEDVLESPASGPTLRVFCNTRHLRLDEASSTGLQIEYVGEARQPSVPANPLDGVPTNHGASEEFDIVVLAVGFGLERDNATSYWRNENIGQPILGRAAETFIVSGQGDGAMIDLLRLRIAQFRQDRILAEVFGGKPELVERLQALQSEAVADPGLELFEHLDELWRERDLIAQTEGVLAELSARLRQDTSVILHLRENRFASLFSEGRISFQNRLLVYVLYRCGGFYPSSVKLSRLSKELSVPRRRMVIRHGTDREAVLSGCLSERMLDAVRATARGTAGLRQVESRGWPAGYFGHRGSTHAAEDVADSIKAKWRKEYLPAPTQAIAAAFVSAVAGFLETATPSGTRLRVTLHRTLLLGDETLLQQCCEYTGTGLDGEPISVIGRTFHVDRGTIGAAFSNQCVLFSPGEVGHGAISSDMDLLSLRAAAREMPDDTCSVLAMPVLTDRYGDGPRVVAVLYADCSIDGLFTVDVMKTLRDMTRKFTEHHLARSASSPGIVNGPFWTNPGATSPDPVDLSALRALRASTEFVPVVTDADYLNHDFSDFERVTTR